MPSRSNAPLATGGGGFLANGEWGWGAMAGEAPAYNTRVPLPLATLAPVKHGPMAFRLRVQY